VVIYQNNRAAEPLRKTTEQLLHLLLRTAGQLSKAAGQLVTASQLLGREGRGQIRYKWCGL
jgi:protein involved in temperature-dependent protein secretion